MGVLRRFNGASWDAIGGIVTGDTLPIGSEVDYDGESVPAGWEEIDDPNEYSTTEQVVGTWIDGKPIYRRVITGTCDNSSEQTIEENITGIGDVVYIGGNFVRISDKLTSPIGAYLQDVPSRVMYHGGLGKILLNKSASVWNTAFNYVIIFEYTKSS